MSEMTARVRNRLQDGVINWQERWHKDADYRQQQADIHRSRMTCSASLQSFHQTQDWTGGIAVCKTNPVIEETRPKRRAVSSEGIRWDIALTALIIAGILLVIILVADLAGIGMSSRSITKLTSSIGDLEKRNELLQAEISMNTDSASVCTEAVKLNLISSNGAKTIRLTAPANAQWVLSSAAQAAENRDLEGRMTSYAGD